MIDWSFYNWELLTQYVLHGLGFSLQLTLIAMVGGILIGTVLALMRLSGNKILAAPATIYVNGLRSIPLVMVILWFYLLIPFATGRPIGKEISAIITFTIFEAAYYSEIMRAGIQSIPRGQVFAGQAVTTVLSVEELPDGELALLSATTRASEADATPLHAADVFRLDPDGLVTELQIFYR